MRQINVIVLHMYERLENIRAFVNVLRKPTLDIPADGHDYRCKNNINHCY